MMKHVGFTGTQKGMTKEQINAVSWLVGTADYEAAHHGDCIGADEEFNRIVANAGLYVIAHPPINPAKRAFCFYNEERPLKDYIPRNHDIVDASDCIIATPAGFEEELRSGTWATIRYAVKTNKPCVIVWPDGTWDPAETVIKGGKNGL